ncbi:MAG: helix-turn-helix domain-containing protein [Sulfuricella sp.]
MSKTKSPTPDEIRAARKAVGLSQTAAAELIYSTMRTWQDWEAGKAHMHPGLWELFRKKKPAVLE